MARIPSSLIAAAASVFAVQAFAQTAPKVTDFKPVTEAVLENPDPGDWLMLSRTFDEQRFSPLNEINKSNVSQLRMAWTRGLGVGTRVEIEGTVRSGVLVATKVKSKTDADIESEGFELDGTITAIDVVNRILVLRGVSVDYSGPVDFRDGTIADLAVGRDVKIKGTLLADGTGLQAVRIKFDH